MWILFGISAIIIAAANVFATLNGKDSRFLAFISLALTALTLCAFYRLIAGWVAMEDWSALMDVVPALSKSVWILSGASILINSICFIKK